MLDARQLEPELTEKDILLRDAFVCEYLKDFDSYRACLRLGFQSTYAVQWSQQLFNDGYVQRKIAHMTRTVVSGPEQDTADRALVEVTLRRIMQRGSDSASTAAAHKMMVLKGWDREMGGDTNEDLAEQYRRLSQALPT